MKDSFFDANIIINFAKYQEGARGEIILRCYSCVSNKKGRFIVCYAVVRELYNQISNLAQIHKQILKKIEDEGYPLAEKGNLSKKNLLIAEKLYLLNKEKDKEEVKKNFAEQRNIFELEIERFLKLNIDEKVIPLEEIDSNLTNRVFDIIPNYADSRIIASALQYQKNRPVFLFVTADEKHINSNNYSFLREQFKITPLKEEYEFPELVNLAEHNA